MQALKRILGTLFALAAVLAGIVVAIVAALAAMAFFFGRRSSRPKPAAAGVGRGRDQDVIDVSATEVRSDAGHRLRTLAD